MGIFVYKTKKGFRVIEEVWTPRRKTNTIQPHRYEKYFLYDQMTYEQAHRAAKEYNQIDNFLKKQDAEITEEVKTISFYNNKSLPKALVKNFELELEKEYKDFPGRYKTIKQHWKAGKGILKRLKINYREFYENRFDIFKIYEENLWSADYIKRITKIMNRWGSYCARRHGGFFEPIPKIGVRYKNIAAKREKKPNIRVPASPIDVDYFNTLKPAFEKEQLIEQWNFIFVSIWFGLRPIETQQLLKNSSKTTYEIKFDPKNKISVLFVYQTKLQNLPEHKRGKIIPVYETEQIEALKIIESKKMKRPLNKTIKRFLHDKNATNYSPRKTFVDLFLNRGYQLEDISTFLGHSSIEVLWRHYKNKFAYQLPKKNTETKAA